MADDQDFPLVEIVSALSEELRHAQELAKREYYGEPVLNLRECTVELALTWERSQQGGIDFRVVKIGAEASRSRVETITLNLAPIAGDDDRFPMPS